MARTEQKIDAVRFLREQHDDVRRLFREVTSASSADRSEPFETLVRTLAVHETAEEEVIYPTLRAAGDEGREIAAARLAEEDQAKKSLAALVKLDPASAEFVQEFAEFRRAVEAHAESDEHSVFPLLERVADEDRRERMASLLKVAETVAPTRPHAAAPESAVGNMLVGPFIAIVDRVRDAIRDASR